MVKLLSGQKQRELCSVLRRPTRKRHGAPRKASGKGGVSGIRSNLLCVASNTTDAMGGSFHFSIGKRSVVQTVPSWIGMYVGGRVSSVAESVQAERLNSCIGRHWRQRTSNVENTVVRKHKAYLKDGRD